MTEKFVAEMFNAKEIVYSTYNTNNCMFCTVDVFDVEEDEEEIIIYGDEKSKAEITLNKHPDKIMEEDDGWQLKYGTDFITINIIK